MSDLHEHRWLISALHARLRTREGQPAPESMDAELRCDGCSAGHSHLSMAQLKAEIQAGRVRPDSLAQWASIAPLFQ